MTTGFAARSKSVFKISRWVSLRSARYYGETEYLADKLLQPPRRFMDTTLLDLAQHIKQVRRFEFSNRTPTNYRKDIGFQPTQNLASVVGGSAIFPIFVPFARHRFKGIARCEPRSALSLALGRGRINVGGQAALGIIPPRACLHEADSWINA
jgi:hypothetical protein